MENKSIQSLGGAARASKLSKEERKEIASKAASARWNVPRATHEGSLTILDKEIPCAVLEDGTRLLTQGGFLKALGRAEKAKGGQGSTVDNMAPFLAATNLKPFISNDLEESTKPLKFMTIKGVQAFGYNADLLPQVCEVYLEARAGGKLHASQRRLSQVAELIVRGLARVGISALVDEATGYQEVRDRKALQLILDKYLNDEWSKWSKRFPDDYYKELFRLKGEQYPTLSGRKPSYVGHWTNKIVYSRLAPGLKNKLKELNPTNEKGNRSKKHHQYLTDDLGIPELKRHLENVIFLMKGCSEWDDFINRLDRAAPAFGDTLVMDI